MKFRAILLAVMVALLGAVSLATIGTTATVIEHRAREDLAKDLERSRHVFEDLLAFRSQLLASECRVVAEEPRLKAVVATEDVEHATMFGVLQDIARAMDAGLLLVTNERGALRVDVADPQAEGFDLSGLPGVKDALARGKGSAVWTENARTYQIHAERVAFGEHVAGVVVLGRAVDRSLISAVEQHTGTQAFVLLDDQVVAGSAPQDPALGKAVLGLAVAGNGATELDVGASRYLSSGGPLPGYSGAGRLRYVLVGSLDAAMAAASKLNRLLALIAAAALLGAVLLSALLAGVLAKPLDALATMARKIGLGDLSTRVTASGSKEIQSLGLAMNTMAEELEASRVQLAEKERMQKELEIARRIQMGILPRVLELQGLEIAARMAPAEEVGGDYYDLLPTAEGGWICIGDVAGHGLPAGLIMVMMRSIVASLVEQNPNAHPKDVLRVLNATMYQSVRDRLGQTEHATLSLMRYHRDGTLLVSGRHEDIVVARSGEQSTHLVETPGMWVGLVPDISDMNDGMVHRLAPGDVMVLYSDGVIEARNASGELFGMQKLQAAVESSRDRPVGEILDCVYSEVGQWAERQQDDITLLVMRYKPESSS